MTETFQLKRRFSGVFAYSAWDAIPVIAAILHLAFVIWLITGFSDRVWWSNILLGFVYAYAISWNINGVSHNFIHTPYFVAPWMNYAFSMLESVAIGFSQCFYRWVHMRHHVGNSDRPSAGGDTLDWLSIYRHGKDGEPESVWRFTFLSFFRDDLGDIYRALKATRPFDAEFGRVELWMFAVFVTCAALYDWEAVVFLAPFYYLGNSLSSLNGYYEHFNGNPNVRMAWGVSTYAPLYNLLWFNNGYHAEHHYRPGVHWTRIKALHASIACLQRDAGTHVIRTSHALGFLDPANRANARSIRNGKATQ